jgi:hypothetical protein
VEIKESMNDLEKLKHLLNHWREHNDDHVNAYNEWAKKAETLGKTDLSKALETVQ